MKDIQPALEGNHPAVQDADNCKLNHIGYFLQPFKLFIL